MADRPKSTNTKRRIVEKQPGMPIATVLLFDRQEKPDSAVSAGAPDGPVSSGSGIKGSANNGTRSPKHSSVIGGTSVTPSSNRDSGHGITASGPKMRRITVNLDARSVGAGGFLFCFCFRFFGRMCMYAQSWHP
eukprot:m.1279387 g.1279387  ORF g.1279387 m.1279387 type:complete len:134 (+) comp24767_c0_seq27:353-754(+)